MTVPPLRQSIARARLIVTHVADDEVWMSKRRMSNGAEAGSLRVLPYAWFRWTPLGNT